MSLVWTDTLVQEEADHLRTDLEAAEENVADMREREEYHAQEMETLQQELMDMKAELEKAQDDKERALEKLGDTAADGSADEVQRLQQEVLDLEAVRGEKPNDLKAVAHVFFPDCFIQDKASLQAELDALRRGAKAKDDQRLEDQERIIYLTKEIETINARTMDMQRSASRAGDLEHEHERLVRVVSDRENEIVQLREEVEKLDSEMHAQNRDLHGYREELEDTLEKLRRVQAERNELDDNLAETMAIIEQKNEDLNIMRDNLEGVSPCAPSSCE
jgi:DNA repair exonuclease SbcCD ATPase subunit